MRYAAYFRISTDETRQKFSMEAQQDSAVKHLESIKDGGILVGEYSDEASGKNMERPNLQRMLADAKEGKFDCILVYKVDRLSRCLRDICQIMKDLEKCGVAFRSITEPFDTSTPIGKAFIQILGVFAELERENICERTRVGMEKKVSKGEWVGHAPFGYDYSTDEKRLIPNEAKSEIIKQIFRWYAVDKMGSRAIALKLNDIGSRTNRGNLWATNSLIALLRNPAFIGKIKRNSNVYEGNHEAIIPESMWNEAQVTLKARRKNFSARRSNGGGYLLSGVLHCAKCNTKMYGNCGHSQGKKHMYYVCGAKQRFGTCSMKSIPKDKIESAIIRQVMGLLSQSDLIQDVERKALEMIKSNRPDMKGELKHVESHILKCQTTKGRYMKAFEDELMSAHECGARMRDLSLELNQLEDRRAELIKACGTEIKPITKEEIKKALSELTDTLKDSPKSLQKSIVTNLVKKASVLSPDSVEATYSLSGIRVLTGSRP